MLVASADGVGTKLAVARLRRFSTVGRDLVNHCVNDILVQGAEPLFFLDYFGAGVLEPGKLVDLVRGVASRLPGERLRAARRRDRGDAGFLPARDYELVGFIVGIADRRRLLDGSRVRPGDVLLGLPSAGLHTNGYSLARRILFDQLGLGLGDRIPGARTKSRRLDCSWRRISPTSSRCGLLLGDPGLHAMAHVTGGGLTDNLPRVLPRGTRAEIRLGSWKVPELFLLLERHGRVERDEMLRVFNMGIGMVLIVGAAAADRIAARLRRARQRCFVVGRVRAGGSGVDYVAG